MRPFRLSPESGKSARIPYQYQSKPRFQRSNSNQNPKDSTLTRCYLPSPVITRPSTVAVGVDDHRGVRRSRFRRGGWSSRDARLPVTIPTSRRLPTGIN